MNLKLKLKCLLNCAPAPAVSEPVRGGGRVHADLLGEPLVLLHPQAGPPRGAEAATAALELKRS